jgi:membrane protease YdiL (CAAX protease family)
MKKLSFRRSIVAQPAPDLDDIELEQPDFLTVFKVVWFSIRSFFTERPGQIIGSAFILLMLWGTHGRLELLGLLWPAWRGPGIDLATRPRLLSWVPWDNELISFCIGALLLVGIPILLIKFVYKQPLSSYGLGLPPKGRRVLAVLTFVVLTLLSLPAFWIATQNESMRQVYPFFRSFPSIAAFALYSLAYLLFFIAIEFIFRGYLLFGLECILDTDVTQSGEGVPGVFYFGKYALLIQMLSYTAWHLGKPLPELWGTLVWGLAAGATAYTVRSIWPVVLSHWLLNVFFDAVVLQIF